VDSKKEIEIMKGYKAFNKDLQCRGMQYEIGGTYELGDTPICCKQGFHFCKSISDCYKFYERFDETRICEVEALGDIVTDNGFKYCTNKIHVIREVENPRVKSNTNETNTGYCNSGNWNSGSRNTGDWNSGDYNNGNCNSGNCNSGNCNSGNYNSGYWNSSSWNSGDHNSGGHNSGDRNSGDFNIGNRNTGNWNIGNFNSGSWNSGNWNSGVFNTEPMPTIKMFDKDSNWTMEDWRNSIAFDIMSKCPTTHSDFVHKDDMSDEEKENHPEYKTLGGYTKIITVTAEDKQKWWDGLSDYDKQVVMALPNFDADKFYQCTGIRVEA
jgi:hypothetical protein